MAWEIEREDTDDGWGVVGEEPTARRELPADVAPSTAGGGRGSVNPPVIAPRRGSLRAVDPYVAPDAPEPVSEFFQRGTASVLDKPLAPETAEYARNLRGSGLTPEEMIQGSKSPETLARERLRSGGGRYADSSDSVVLPTGGVGAAVDAAPGMAARSLGESALTLGATMADFGITMPWGPQTAGEFRSERDKLRHANASRSMAMSDKALADLGPLLSQIVPSARTVADGLAEVGKQSALALTIGPGAIIADIGIRSVDDGLLVGMSPGAALTFGAMKALAEGVPEAVSARFALGQGKALRMSNILTDPTVALEAAKRFGKTLGVELGTEQAAAVGGWLADRVTNDKTATMDRLGRDMVEAVKATLVQAPGMMAVGKAASVLSAPPQTDGLIDTRAANLRDGDLLGEQQARNTLDIGAAPAPEIPSVLDAIGVTPVAGGKAPAVEVAPGIPPITPVVGAPAPGTPPVVGTDKTDKSPIAPVAGTPSTPPRGPESDDDFGALASEIGQAEQAIAPAAGAAELPARDQVETPAAETARPTPAPATIMGTPVTAISPARLGQFASAASTPPAMRAAAVAELQRRGDNPEQTSFPSYGTAGTPSTPARTRPDADGGAPALQQPAGGAVAPPMARQRTVAELRADADDVGRLGSAFAAVGYRRDDGTEIEPEVVREPLDAQQDALISTAAALGVRLVPVRGIPTDGVTIAGDADADTAPAAFFNVDATVGGKQREALAVFVAGHESLHHLRKTNPRLYGQYRLAVQQYLNDGAVDNRLKAENDALLAGEVKVSREYADEEVVADINGSMWLDSKFWRRLIEIDRNGFRQLRYRFMANMARIIGALRTKRGDVSKLVNDVAAVRELTAQLWAEKAGAKLEPENSRERMAEEVVGSLSREQSTTMPAGERDGSQSTTGQQAQARELRQPGGVRGGAGLVDVAPGQSAGRDAAAGPVDAGRERAPGVVQEGPPAVGYGTARQGAISVVGYHYSQADRSSLSSAMYGTGLRGAERARLEGADKRLLQRVYFYADTGNGVSPESGVGGRAHRVELRNVYDADSDTLRLRRDAGDANAFELALIKGGFDGYVVRDGRGAIAVLVGQHDVPVERLGPRTRIETGGKLPPAKRRLSIAERIVANKTLPAGQLTGARWLAAIEREMPEVARLHRGNPAWSSTKPMYRDELGRELERGAQARPLAGQPVSFEADGLEREFQPFSPAQRAAEEYMASAGLPYSPTRQWGKIDRARAKRIADEFDRMEHAPDDPDVAAAYGAMIDETLAQWQAIKATGLEVEFITGADPYGNPRNAILDVVKNNHLWVYPTDNSYTEAGAANQHTGDNPLLRPVGETISGLPASANDIFRIVHDYFGHIKDGNGFRAEGEENAWRSHSAMYSPLARRAMTSETRGQNSWVNFGPFAEANATADGANTQYAPQKIGLLPEWVSEDGAGDLAMSRGQGDMRYRARAAELAAKEPAPMRSAVKFFTGKQNIPRGLDTNEDIAAYFTEANKRGMTDWPSRDAQKRMIAALRSDVLHALQDEGNAVGWYDRKVKAALAHVAKLHPEIAKDEEAKFGFIAMLAITSNSTKVSENFDNAERLYSIWKDTGNWPTELPFSSKAGDAILAGIVTLRDVTVRHGWKRARDFMLRDHPLADIEAFSGVQITSELRDEEVYGAVFLGSKVGAFFNNLYGNFTPVTMDRWFMRTINRVRGNMLSLPQSFDAQLRGLVETLDIEEAGLREKVEAEINGFLVTPNESRADALVARELLPFTLALVRERHKVYSKGGFKERHKANTRAKAVFEAMTLDNQAPEGGAERRLLRSIMRELQDGLRDDGIPITMADLQAALWYYEKDLFALLKKGGTTADMFGLVREAEDYEEAARKLVEGRRGGGVRGKGPVAPGRGGRRGGADTQQAGVGQDALAFSRDQADDYNPNAAYKDIGDFPDALDSVEVSEIDKADLEAEIAAELAAEGFSVAGRPLAQEAGNNIVDMADVSPKIIKSAGLFAESAYPDPQYKLSGETSDTLVAGVRVAGHLHYLTVSPGRRGADMTRMFEQGMSTGYETPGIPGSSFVGMSERSLRDFNKRMAAAVDLFNRSHDLYTTIGGDARSRVRETWRKIAALPGAAEFGPQVSGSGKTMPEVVQTIADKMTAGTKFTARVTREAPYIVIYLTTTDGETKKGLIEIVEGKNRRAIMHTAEFDKGSGFGKAFYQIAFAYTDQLDIPVEADAFLLGVNNYRRTEQMMSAAARSGKTRNIRPGAGQRIYGWNRRATTPEQEDRNFVRLALAAARNAAELVPEVQGLRYDIETDTFRDRLGGNANNLVADALRNPDARATSVSRSTLARAAITFEAIEREVDLRDVERAKSPVLYSRTQAAADQTETPEFKAWFGKSKVVDADGKPKVVYHGTGADFERFGTNFDGAHYFSDSAETASWFAVHGDKGWDDEWNPNVKPAYLSIRNPKVITRAQLQEMIGDDRDKTGMDWASMPSVVSDAKKQGHDGILLAGVLEYNGAIGDQWLAFRPEQIKSAIGNSGAFDPASPDITMSRAQGGWDAPAPSRLDSLIYTLQDKQIDLKRVTQEIKDVGRQLTDRTDGYLREELYHGRVSERINSFLSDELEPLLVEMRAAGVKMADFEEYLHARHARERNAAMARINPGMPNNTALSGMTDADARRILAAAPPVMATLAQRVDAMVAGSRDLMERSGIETSDTVNALRGAYQFYVPLHRDEAHGDSRPPQGSGYSIKGSVVKRATGSTAEVTNVLAHLALEREAVITRAEKNLVGMAVYAMALQNPNPEWWSTDQPTKKRDVDPRTGLVVERIDPLYKSAPNVLVLKVNGEDRIVTFNERNERAARMATAMKNLDVANMGMFKETVAVGTRWLAAVNTQYNPVFALVNAVRDVQGAMVNLSTTAIAGKQAKVFGGFAPALSAIWSVERDAAATGAWQDVYREFKARGAKTGWRQSYAGGNERGEAIAKELAALDRGAVGRLAHGLVDLVGDGNTAIENAIRLSAYKAALDAGVSKDRAASIAKNLTVNFNRKGQVGAEVGAFYAFFNAAVQGTARLAEVVRGPRGKAIIAGGIGIGVLQALMLAGMDDEDRENLPEWMLERSLVFPLGDSKFVQVPMPLGLHVLPNIGRHLGEVALALSKGERPQAAGRLGAMLGTIMEAFNPVGGTGTTLQMVLPSVVDPIAQLGENKDFTGRPIYRERSEFDPSKPGFALGRDLTSPVWKGAAYVINLATGGDEFARNTDLPPAASPQPEAMRFVAETIGGGIWRETEKVIEASIGFATGVPQEAFRLPVIGRFYGELDNAVAPQSKFYENAAEVEALDRRAKGLKESDAPGDEKRLDRLLKEHPEADLYGDLKKVRKELRELREERRELAINGEDKARAREIEQEMGQIMREFNAEVRKAKKP